MQRQNSETTERLLPADADRTVQTPDDEQASLDQRTDSAFWVALEEAMQAGMAACDVSGRQTYVNRAFCKMVGWSAEELIGQVPPYRYWPPEERETIAKAFAATLTGQPPASGFVLRLCRSNEQRFDALVLPAPMHDGQGEAIGWVASITDISEQVRSQRALRESEARFKALFDHSRDAIGIAARGVILYVNQAYADMLGYASPEALVGLSTLAIVAEADRQRLLDLAARRAAGETGPDVYEYRALHQDGRERDIENRVTSYELDGERYTLVISRDVTERTKRLRAQQFLVESSAVLASSLDTDSTLETISKLAVPHLADWCVIHLADEEGHLNQVVVSHVRPDSVERAREYSRRYPPDPNAEGGVYSVYRTGETICLAELTDEMLRASTTDQEQLRILREAGMCSFLCVPLTARGRCLGTIAFIGAESGHRYGPEDVELAEELGQRAGLAIENARLYRAAQDEIARRQQIETALVQRQTEVEALNARLRLAVFETHDRVRNNLQNILAIIALRLEASGETIPREEYARLKSYILTLSAVHTLLKLQAGEDVANASVSIRQVMEKVRDISQEAVPSRTVRLEVQDRSLSVHQATNLALIATELIHNSIKHGTGNIDLTFAVDEAEQACLEVCDDGPGFADKFWQDTVRTTGLIMVNHLVDWNLKGNITYENRPGRGACIRVSFSLVSVPLSE